jgi:hypothetical protein
MLLGFRRRQLRLSVAGFAAAYVLAVAFSVPAASILTIFAAFCSAGWSAASLSPSPPPPARRSCFSPRAAPSAISCATASAAGSNASPTVSRKDAFSYLLVLRLAPVFPFFVMNIAPALFNVSLRTYVAATFLGILPGTFAYAFLGEGIDSVLVAAEEAGTRSAHPTW